MVRTVALLCSLAAFSVGWADEPKKPDDKLPAFAAEVETIKKEVEHLQVLLERDMGKQYEAAKTEAEREAVAMKTMEASRSLCRPSHEKALKLLRPNAADPAAVPGLVWLAQSDGLAVAEESAGLLRKHHLTHADTLKLARTNRRAAHAWVEPLLRDQLASGNLPDDQRLKVQLNLATHLQTKASLPDLLEWRPEQTEVVYGKEQTAAFRKMDVQKLEAEAVKLFEELIAKHAEAKLTDQLTIGEVAKGAVYEIKNLGVGKTAPEISGEDLSGEKFKLSDYRGKVVLLSFWGSWCGPCMAQLPRERELTEKFRDRPFALVGVNSDPDKGKLKPVLERHKITWRSFWCGEKGREGEIPQAWNVVGWPTVYLIDAQGVIRAKKWLSPKLDERIEELVKKAEAAGKK